MELPKRPPAMAEPNGRPPPIAEPCLENGLIPLLAMAEPRLEIGLEAVKGLPPLVVGLVGPPRLS